MDTVNFKVSFTLPSKDLGNVQKCLLDNKELVISACQEVIAFGSALVTFSIECRPEFINVFRKEVYGICYDNVLVKRLFIRKIKEKGTWLGIFASYEECEKYLGIDELISVEYKWADINISNISMSCQSSYFSTNFERSMAKVLESTDVWTPAVSKQLWGIKDV